MMTVKQAAADLGVSVALVYALCAAGKIEHERYGLRRGTIRISPGALAKYRESAAGTPPVVPVQLKHLRLPAPN